MYLFIVFCKDLLCIPFHFGSRTFICAFTIFCFPPSLTLFSCFHMGLVDLLISVFHLAFTRFESYGAPISGLLVLAYMCYHGFSIWSLSLTPFFASLCFVFNALMTFMSIVAFRRTCDNAQWCIKYIQSTRMGCWCHLVKWFDWSMVESNLVQQWDKPSSRWKGSAFWDQKRDKVKREDRMRLLVLRFILFVCEIWILSH